MSKFAGISSFVNEMKEQEEKPDQKPIPKKTNNPAPQAAEAETVSVNLPEIMQNRLVKKTFEIKLVHEIAIENLKAERKRKGRITKSEKALTINGIVDEILQEFFDRPENRNYLLNAMQELSDN